MTVETIEALRRQSPPGQGLLTNDDYKSGCITLGRQEMAPFWHVLMQIRDVFLQHIVASFPAFIFRSQVACVAASSVRSDAPVISPAAASEVIFLMRRAFDLETDAPLGSNPQSRRSLWNQFVHQYIGHHAALQVAIMFGKFDPMMADICRTVRTSRESGSTAAGASEPGCVAHGTCARCRESVSGCLHCWLCGRTVCTKCCIQRDCRCKENDGCRAFRQRQLDTLYAGVVSRLRGLRLVKAGTSHGREKAPAQNSEEGNLTMTEQVAMVYLKTLADGKRTR